jgi:anthranilate phosphoribosyltransferase
MLKPYIAQVMQRKDLTVEQAEQAMQIIMTGEATQAQIGGYLVALRMKGETVDEITGSAQAMRANATRIQPYINGDPLLDTAGTGGDGAHTFNISTAAAFILAGAGRKVAKHGNRAASSRCGSADVLGELGMYLDLTPEQVSTCIEQVGIGFLFAPRFHPAMKYAIGPRRELGQRTIFNILGPLTNPAGADCQVMGVYRQDLVEPLAHVLKNLGCRRGYVVYGSDGMDEITLTGPTHIGRVSPEGVTVNVLRPEELGLPLCTMADLRGGDAKGNATIVRSILSGEKGPKRDVVLLNAAYALMAAGKADTAAAGMALAVDSIDSGRALQQLEKLVELTNE